MNREHWSTAQLLEELVFGRTAEDFDGLDVELSKRGHLEIASILYDCLNEMVRKIGDELERQGRKS